MAAGGGGDGEGQELNLIPYLDVMVNLVIFMLFSMTSFLAFTVLNASIPQLSPNKAVAKQQLKKKSKELLLMVRVTNKGFIVDPSVQGGKNLPRATIGKSGDTYNFEGLRERGKKLKEQFPEETRVLILAQPRIRYEDIIKTMDAVRDKEEDGDEELFPDITLSVM